MRHSTCIQLTCQTHAAPIGLPMWLDRSFPRTHSAEIDLEDAPTPPAPHLLPIPRFVDCAASAEQASDSSGTSMRYSPSDGSMVEYGMSSATPSSSTSEDGLASCLLFTEEVSEYRFLGPPCNKADDLAYIAMCDGAVSYGQIGVLAGLLPECKTVHHRYAANQQLRACFGTGAFIHGPHAGVRKHAVEYPWCSVLLAAMLRSYFPGKPFSSCVLQMNMPTNAHRDQHNDVAIDNLVLACSKWEGGHLWLEDPEGDVLLEDGSKGRLLNVQPKAMFDGHVRHKAMPWTGSRTVVVGFHIRDAWRLRQREVQYLARLGFVLQGCVEC